MTNSAQSTTFNYFVGSGLVLTDTTKSTADLVPLQLGIFNSKNYKALANQTSSKVVPEIIIAMGSPNEEKISWTNAAMSFKSVPIRADKLIAWRKSTPKKALNHKVAIGWDGTSDCKTITATCDEAYTLFLQIEGSPATRFFGAKPLTETFVVQTGCCDDCVSGCSADVESVVDNFVGQINKHPRISPFVKAEKLVSYTAAPTATTVAYESYTLTIADEGGIQELAAIQATYSNAVITRTERNGILSTYTLVQIGSASAPADYSNQSNVVISNCSDCPSGYALVEKTYKYKVQRQDAGTAGTLATIASDYSDAGAYRLSYVNGESTYVVTNTTGTAPSAVTAGDIVTYVGYNAPYCNLETATTVAWEESDAYYKTVRELCLVLGDDVCDDVSGTSQLAAITSFYASNSSVVSGSVAQSDNGTCANTYTIEQVSDNLMKEGCTTDIAVFSNLDPFKNSYWTVCCDEVSTAGTVDKIGIVLTGAYVDTKFGTCSFKYDDFVELDLPRIIVRQGDFVELENKCSTRWAVTELQAPVYPTGVGTNVKKEYIDIMSTKGQRWSDDPRWREIYGYNYDFIKAGKFYKHFYLEFESLDKFFTSTGYGGNDFKQTVVFAFEEETDTTNFEKLLESWISSSRPDLIDSDPQDNLYR
jgi:hypothetical protein